MRGTQGCSPRQLHAPISRLLVRNNSKGYGTHSYACQWNVDSNAANACKGQYGKRKSRAYKPGDSFPICSTIRPLKHAVCTKFFPLGCSARLQSKASASVFVSARQHKSRTTRVDSWWVHQPAFHRGFLLTMRHGRPDASSPLYTETNGGDVGISGLTDTPCQYASKCELQVQNRAAGETYTWGSKRDLDFHALAHLGGTGAPHNAAVVGIHRWQV